MMLPAVALALGLMTTTFALPVTPEVQVPTGFQGVPQTNLGVPIGQQGEKTGFQGSSEVYTPTEQIAQQNAPVPKVENVPVAVENQQTSYTESPVLLPIQPLSVVPVSPAGQVLRPVIVPAEAIAAGRVIIMSIEPIQQRSFPDAVAQPEKQVPIQQVVQPAIYTPVQAQAIEPNQQPYYQPTEKQTPLQQTVQQTEQIQLQPNQGQLIKEQNVQNVEYQNPVPQVYNVQPVVAETVPYQVPVNPHSVEPQYPVQKQGYQQGTPVQGQETSEYQQFYKPVVVENVEKQGSQQPYDIHHQDNTYNPHQQQPLQQVYNVQPGQQQVYNVQPGQQQVYNVQPAEQQVYNAQPAEQQVYNVQPVEQQVHNVQHVEPQIYNAQPTEQQVHNVQPVPAEKQGVPYVQTPYVEPQQQQVQQVQQVQHVEKQASQQKPAQSNEYVPVQGHPVEPFYQQQVYSVTGQVQDQVPYQQVSHTQAGAPAPEQKSQAPEVEQYHQVQNQQVETYAGQPPYNFGDKLPQIHENNPIRTQSYSVQPSSVLSAQE